MFQSRYGFDGIQSGSLVGIVALMGVFGAIASGYLSDRLPRWQVMSVIVVLEALSLLALVLGNSGLVYVFVVVFGFGQGAHALNRALLGEYFGNTHYARLWGIISIITTPLAAAGPIYAGWTSEVFGYGRVIFTFMLLYLFSSILYWNCRRPSLPFTPIQESKT